MAATTTRSSATPVRDSASRARYETPMEETTAEAESDVLQSMSRRIYSGSYALSYGVVYATVFVVQMMPQENPVMHGFHDGGKAAMDELSTS